MKCLAYFFALFLVLSTIPAARAESYWLASINTHKLIAVDRDSITKDGFIVLFVNADPVKLESKIDAIDKMILQVSCRTMAFKRLALARYEPDGALITADVEKNSRFQAPAAHSLLIPAIKIGCGEGGPSQQQKFIGTDISSIYERFHWITRKERSSLTP